jgi:predicted nuclease of predicted toxin-antitoxin system
LSLRLLIDEDSQAKLLINLLRKAGHDVFTVNEAKLTSEPDDVVFNYAIKEKYILLTHNCDDFKALHMANPYHSGILAVYRSANSSKNMDRKDILRAIANLETANFPLANQFISLNHWSY